DVLSTDADAPDVVLPLDELLEDHRFRPVARCEPTRLVVRPDELLLAVHAIDVLPTTAGVRLEDGGKAGVSEERIPVERVLPVAQRLVRDLRDVRLVRPHRRLRSGALELAGAAKCRHLGAHALRRALPVHDLDERVREGVLAPDDEPDDFLVVHMYMSTISRQ